MTDSEELKALVRQRGVLKSRQTTFKNYINLFQQKMIGVTVGDVDRKSIIEMEDRLSKQEEIFVSFGDIQNQIDMLSDNQEEQLVEREHFENVFYQLVAEAKSILEKFNGEPSEAGSGSSVSNASIRGNEVVRGFGNSGIKLPPINLTKFTGNYKQWLEFRDLFDSIINSNSEIPEIQRFHYLRASLEGGAAQVIRSIEVSGSNYQLAWQTLCERYDNRGMLVSNHVKSLFNIPNIASESANELRKMVDSISTHVQSLKALNQPTESWDTLLIYIFTNKLDKKSLREWEERKNEIARERKKEEREELPEMIDFMNFIKQKADLLETLEPSKDYSQGSQKLYRGEKRNLSALEQGCVICQGAHSIPNCSNFIKLSVNDRILKVKGLKFCFNCLRSGHLLKDCSGGNCKKCNLKHNTLLHYDKSSGSNESTRVKEKESGTLTNKQGASTSGMNETSMAMTNQERGAHVLLQTAVVEVLDVNGVPRMCRVLLDSGSQLNLITEGCCEKLGLKMETIHSSVTGVGQIVTQLSQRCPVRIRSRQTSFQCECDCVVIPTITSNYPSYNLDVSSWNIPRNLRLADPGFDKRGEIELLLGGELYLDLLCVGQVKLSKGLPTLQKTRFGWVLGGEVRVRKPQVYNCHLMEISSLNDQLVKFWELEEVSRLEKVLSSEEELCETVFSQTTTRNSEGRFVVQLPLKNPPSLLGDSKRNAIRRFWNLEKSFARNNSFQKSYVNFMEEYISMGHMVRVSSNRETECESSFYFPHHGIVNEKSPTTKLRVVFDGSAISDSGVSLNDLQGVGPTIQDELLAILLRFRQHNIVICADIVKMYRQILIDKSQLPLQRILWRSDPSKELETYELQTVTYGTSSAPFLAVRCLNQLAREWKCTYPRVCEVLLQDFYMDDMITGVETLQEANQLCDDMRKVLGSACFELQKWASNRKEVLNHVRSSSASALIFGDKEKTKTLGLYWESDPDVLMYSIRSKDKLDVVTKRAILSEISQIFDPLGLLAPFIIVGKIILQRLWLIKLSWDETLPLALDTRWRNVRGQLSELNYITIPRCITQPQATRLEIHGFSDASLEAYGACIYIRTVDPTDRIQVRLLCAKSRVAPLKTVSVPKLELCACLLLAKLVDKVKLSMTLNVTRYYLWCDSMICLSWIVTPPNILQTFVSNRVSQIQSWTSPSEWSHISTKENPADVLSRGMLPRELKECELWWYGPQWLSKPSEMWPISAFKPIEPLPEIRKRAVVLKIELLDLFPFKMFSSLVRMRRVCAYCLRFMANCKGKKLVLPLTAEEVQEALVVLLKMSQRESFSVELSELVKKNCVNAKGRLAKLNPFIDKHGVLRVGGRIALAEYPYEKKHPALLSADHHFTRLVFENEHVRLLHAGPQHLLASTREHYWTLRGRDLAKQVVHRCVRCFKVNPTTLSPLMGLLPSERLIPAPPFTTVGVDYAGPLLIKNKRGRGSTKSKCYIALYVCFLTKAIHLELVTDLTKDAFLASFRRFVSRRGKPLTVVSDNGTNFIGARNELRELGKFLRAQENSIIETVANQGVAWKFIPAFSPHFGGLWEAGIKSCKSHLKRVLANACLTFEDLYTILCQIESTLNSRPLTPLSTDPNDLSALTPSHFLLGRVAGTLPDPCVLEIKESTLSHYQRLQALHQHYWKRWSREYISELQCRTKWQTNRDQLQVGRLVVLKEDNMQPLQWTLGRMVKVHPGPDGICRVAEVQTVRGCVKRAFSKICVLPVES